ncbi:unnamed protein product, partial [Symbiodinium sp. KB8]
GAAVFLFTKGQDGEWKAQHLAIEDWKPSASPYLRDPTNWYLVDAYETKAPSTFKLAAKTVIACSPDPKHYSNFVKDGELFTYLSADGILNSVTVCSPGAATLLVDEHYDKLVELWNAGKPESRYDKIGGNLRALLSAEVDFCCAGAAALVANAHYDKLVELWSKQDEPARYWFQKFVGPLLTFSWFHKNFAAWTITNEGSADRASWRRKRCDDLKIAENLQLLECDSTTIFEDRWQKALQKATLSQQVLSSPAGYPGIDYLLEFNHGIQVTTAGKHNLALQFREKLKTMFNGTRHSFTLT